VDTGFPPARSTGKALLSYLMLRRAKPGPGKIMLKQEAKAKWRFNFKSFRFSGGCADQPRSTGSAQ
jgi:hypothetical protein